MRRRIDVLAFAEVAEQLVGYSSNVLVALHTQEIMEKEVVTSRRELHWRYVSETIEQAILPITNTLNRQKVLAFANRPVHTKKGI
jgi:hypothetical protein